MPTSLTLSLTTRGQSLPDNAIPALHATFFQWLERGNAEIARHVHEVSDPKPYTVSPLAIADDGARFRITLLDDALWAPLKIGIESKPEVRVLWATLPLAIAPLVEQRTYAQIAQAADDQPVVILQFDSPTSFKSHGMHYPLPDPVLVFESYRARWNAFAPELLRIADEWADWLRQSVAVQRAEVRTQSVQFKDYQQIGFVGVVEYAAVNRAPDRAGIAPLNALALYAEFCGTGHKTTQGMGQTRRLESWGDAEIIEKTGF
jgi:CRISPR-associated endoribonuclease Cas6